MEKQAEKRSFDVKATLQNGLTYSRKNFDQVLPFILLVVVLVLISIVQPGAISGKWLANKIDGAMVLILASMGQSLVMLMYGTDLSIAGIICLTNTLSALFMPNTPFGVIGTILAMCLLGVVAGIFNGFIITRFKMQPFIVTLATWSIFDGLALYFLPRDGGNVAPLYSNFMMQRIGILPISVFILPLLILMWSWLKRTRFGVAIFAIGRNETAAHNSGINVNMVKLKVYAFSGLFAALAGTYRTAYVASGSPTAGDGYVLLTCCAAVLGGINVASGRGSLHRTIVGAFVLQLITDLLVFCGLSTYWTSLIQGALLIIVVATNSGLDLLRKKRNLEV